MYYLKNPDSSGASVFLEKTLEKKTGVSKAYNVHNKQCTTLKIPIPAVPRRSWRKHSKKKQELVRHTMYKTNNVLP